MKLHGRKLYQTLLLSLMLLAGGLPAAQDSQCATCEAPLDDILL